jgi:phosphomannomutase
MPHRFDPTILREYDIRGVVGDTLHPADAHALGRSFAVTLARAGGRSVAVGYDGRLTSKELEAALVEGLAEGGIDVMRVGLGPTPMLYFAAATLGVDGGLMVTGSHNPPDHNGFKMVLLGKPFFGEAIQRLAQTVDTLGPPSNTRGRITERVVFSDYLDRVQHDYDGAKLMKVAWDPGNGATGDAITALTKVLPGDHVLINQKIDGNFPAHHPDPTVAENLVQLQEIVAKEKCDLGIAFDGDGDRIGVVDAQGRILWGDQLVMILARDLLSNLPGSKILADVKASQVLFDEVARLGGEPVMAPTGHSRIKSLMAETGAPLAGEMSGHIFYADHYYGYDDAVYVAVRLLGILGRSEKSLADMLDEMPHVINTPELRLPCPEARKFVIVKEIHERMKQRGAAITDIDGVRVKTDDGWWLVRASNTGALVVARAEATTEEGFARVKAELAAELEASGLALPDV